ncbi:MAG: hypothetical protein CVV52_03265 [Spirochaetae bacterium HGW-Spirochaetae-8]|nr:MAG: hypothetical protein CVV52_03265 [Spirochaetae bacterium HGW-Spirochaetae-8]
MQGGARVWYFPDGYLPKKVKDGLMEAHEALMLLNTSTEDVVVTLDFYFSDRKPIKDILVPVLGETVVSLRLDHPEDIGGVMIEPLVQYAIRVRSPKPIVAQFGRLDTTQVNMAYYGSMGFFET